MPAGFLKRLSNAAHPQEKATTETPHSNTSSEGNKMDSISFHTALWYGIALCAFSGLVAGATAALSSWLIVRNQPRWPSVLAKLIDTSPTLFESGSRFIVGIQELLIVAQKTGSYLKLMQKTGSGNRHEEYLKERAPRRNTKKEDPLADDSDL